MMVAALPAQLNPTYSVGAIGTATHALRIQCSGFLMKGKRTVGDSTMHARQCGGS